MASISKKMFKVITATGVFNLPSIRVGARGKVPKQVSLHTWLIFLFITMPASSSGTNAARADTGDSRRPLQSTTTTPSIPAAKDVQFNDCVNSDEYSCQVLRQGFKMNGNFSSHGGPVHVFCYRGELKKPWKLWKRPQVKLSFAPDASYKVYWGRNFSDILDQYKTDYMAHLTMIYRPETLTLDPFNASCIGVSSEVAYHLHFSVKSIELWYPFLQLLGIFFFFYAKRLSKNAAFHYGTGMSVGVAASILIVAYIIGRYIPRRAGFLTVFLGGWSILAYVMYYVWYQLRSILEDHYQFVVGYLVVVGMISFGVCYKYGPVSDPRSLNLIQWAIQLVGLLLIYFCCQIPEIAAGVIVLMLGFYNFPRSLIDMASSFRYRFFPPKRRLLTEEEFIREGDEETRQALEDLRQFCRSPDCNAWKTISRLRTPKRFASFIEGDSHLTDQEMVDYDSDPEPVVPQGQGDVINDDDDDSSDSEINNFSNRGNFSSRWRPPNGSFFR